MGMQTLMVPVRVVINRCVNALKRIRELNAETSSIREELKKKNALKEKRLREKRRIFLVVDGLDKRIADMDALKDRTREFDDLRRGLSSARRRTQEDYLAAKREIGDLFGDIIRLHVRLRACKTEKHGLKGELGGGLTSPGETLARREQEVVFH